MIPGNMLYILEMYFRRIRLNFTKAEYRAHKNFVLHLYRRGVRVYRRLVAGDLVRPVIASAVERFRPLATLEKVQGQ